jgi:hypothetical protein
MIIVRMIGRDSRPAARDRAQSSARAPLARAAMAATMGGGGQPNPLAAAAAGSAARLPEQEEEPTLALGYA